MNSPKFFTCLNPDEELNFQYKVLSSLDVVEEKLNISGVKASTDLRELYLGMLYSLETHKMYGYVTNTKIKIIIIVDSTNLALRDNEIRSMFRKIHSEYADIVCNPFYIPGETICSNVQLEKYLSLCQDGLDKLYMNTIRKCFRFQQPLYPNKDAK